VGDTGPKLSCLCWRKQSWSSSSSKINRLALKRKTSGSNGFHNLLVKHKRIRKVAKKGQNMSRWYEASSIFHEARLPSSTAYSGILVIELQQGAASAHPWMLSFARKYPQDSRLRHVPSVWADRWQLTQLTNRWLQYFMCQPKELG
jgi:hypothetical protein